MRTALDGAGWATEAPSLICLLGCLVRYAGCTVLLILDRLRVIRLAKVRACLVGRKVEMFSLPPSSPELNPEGPSAAIHS